MSARNGGKSKKGSGCRTGNKRASKLHRSKAGHKARLITMKDRGRHAKRRHLRKLAAKSA